MVDGADQTAAPRRPAVIGFGHPDRCDDRVGWYVVERLAERGWADRVELVCRHQLELEEAEAAAARDRIVFVDARLDDPVRPDRADWELGPIAPHVETTAISHCLTPATVLALAEALYGRAPRDAWLGTARAHRLDFGQELTPPTRAAADALIAAIEALLGRWLEECEGAERNVRAEGTTCTSSR